MFCTNPTAARFSDVVAGGDANATELALAINCLATAGIAQGFPGGTYGPQAPVTRRQMAAFIGRMVDAASNRERTAASVRELPAVPATSPFRDVPRDGSDLTNNILRLNAAGIVGGNPGTAQQPGGIGADLYGPDLNVTRSQMASFLNRAVAYMTGGDPARAGTAGNGFAAPDAEYYVDPQQATHTANVNGITSAGISNGVGGQRYDGLASVSRQQMARFIARTVAALYGQDRSFSLLETLSSKIAAAGRTDDNRVTGTGRDSTRFIEFTGLTPNTDYRVTLVRCDNVTRGANDLVTFTRNTDGTVNAGAPSTRILGIGRGESGDGAPSGTTNTLVVNSEMGTAFSVLIGEATAPECVIGVLSLNGGPGRTGVQGGTSPALELDSAGRPTEPFGITGRTTFGTPPPSGTATVTPTTATVRAGEPFIGEVKGDQPITSTSVAGDCVEGGAVTDTDTADPGVQFSLVVDEFALSGECVLTFTTTFQNGTTDEDVVTIDVLEGDFTSPEFERVSATTTATAVVFFTEALDCTTVDADGSDFALSVDSNPSDPSAPLTPVDVAAATCDGDAVTLTAERAFTDGEVVILDRVPGTVVADPQGNEQFDEEQTFFVVGAPLIQQASATEGAGQDGVVDQGDTLTLILDESVSPGTGGPAQVGLFLFDEDGDFTEVRCGSGDSEAGVTDALCVFDGTRVTVELLEGAMVAPPDGTDGVFRFPLSIVGTTGLVDAQGNEVDTVNSPDTTIDVVA